MSDGGNDATQAHRRTLRADHGRRAGAGPPPTLGAAPWERFSEPPSEHNVHRWQAEPPRVEPLEPVEPEARETQKGGSHTGGALTVAELLAKVGTPAPGRPTHHHVAPDTESSEVAPGPPVDLQPTQVIEIPAYSLDIVS